ncbi:putative mitochondrial hypothetical protein [Leptomonas pyrrhocoris]|uniref:Uncharacterized protein n=1 Tax=Leptomonas pyrrhocoris TaxID=157538 RepID=A0A0N0DVT5_LEPPY|nr:putative mitochondrial hypothetical protein [Leptomonas pyrrhocoris]KPA80792.1 putative mitochondrial hypothetical protein [Leptomonas pyrrhocoris]|eukprot:XP_015659231.1 putative mitochondrial hypothetical protein [Leptomonas pyrrhocoris]
MLNKSAVLLRRGKPRPRAGMFPDKYRRVPALLKPQQGGQQYFSDFLIRSANDAVEQQQQQQQQQAGYYHSSMVGDVSGQLRSGARPERAVRGTAGEAEAALHGGAAADDLTSPRLPQADLQGVLHRSRPRTIQEELQQLAAQDGFTAQRGFNERVWYEQETAALRSGKGPQHQVAEGNEGEDEQQEEATSSAKSTALPQRILGDDYFRHQFGYSLLKGEEEAAAPADGLTAYAQLDLWGELPKYNKDFIFLYLVSRRRNTYAVAYDYGGKRLLNTYTAGNRGLKGGDRGFRGDGSTDNGHQVTSMYLNDLLPKVREARAASGHPLGRGEKVDLVVRVMGFYNGRQGAVRAVQDRSADYRVRYLEDITPFPLNGPKMPRGVFR